MIGISGTTGTPSGSTSKVASMKWRYVAALVLVAVAVAIVAANEHVNSNTPYDITQEEDYPAVTAGLHAKYG
jgi:hypothetical protein